MNSSKGCWEIITWEIEFVLKCFRNELSSLDTKPTRVGKSIVEIIIDMG